MGPSRSVACLAFCISLFISCASYDPLSLQTRRYDIDPGRPNQLRIAHISDLHARNSATLHDELVRRLKRLDPDILLITGDTVTQKGDYKVADKLLGRLQAELPKLAVRGNWDLRVDQDPAALTALFEAHNGILLINQYKVLDIKDWRLVVYGADDLLYGDYQNPSAQRLRELAQGGEKAIFIIMVHEPDFVDGLESDMLELEGALAFSGHTHGGQITFFGLPLYLPGHSGPYLSGEYRRGKLRLFVSRGIGTSRVDFRFFARPDIMIYEL